MRREGKMLVLFSISAAPHALFPISAATTYQARAYKEGNLGILIRLVIPLTLRHAGLGNLDQGRLAALPSSMSDEAQAHMVRLLSLFCVNTHTIYYLKHE